MYNNFIWERNKLLKIKRNVAVTLLKIFQIRSDVRYESYRMMVVVVLVHHIDDKNVVVVAAVVLVLHHIDGSGGQGFYVDVLKLDPQHFIHISQSR